MRNFILPEGFKDERELRISGEQFHYLRRVLRLREGDELSGTDGKERIYTLSVGEIRRHSLTLLVTGYKERSVDDCRISLLQCLPKGKKMDLIVRQAAEAGVWRIIPFFSSYSIPRIENAAALERKVSRWRRIIKEALQQSGSLCPTGIEQPVNMEAFVGDKEIQGLKIFFHQEPISRFSLHGLLATGGRDITLLIGPEGGLAEKEIEFLEGAGFFPVYLGGRVLRSETAALFAVAAVQTILKEKSAWKIVN
ncbi:Ribosomal RNA small subunit methyltransferase E [subsurface metagenome]